MNRICGRTNKIAGMAACALTMLCLFVILSAQSAWGQGLKVTTLNPPGSSAGSTFPFGMNKSNDVVGYYLDGSGDTVGFLYAAGKYTNFDASSLGASNYTRTLGINDSNKIVGDYIDTASRVHGYISVLVSGVWNYTRYDYNSTDSSSLFGISSTGDYVGTVGHGTGFPTRAFTDVGGVKHDFYASGTDYTYGYAMNSSNVIVGEWFDASNFHHGFSANSDGTNIQEIKYPGATQTACYGINDAGEITGTYWTSTQQYGFTYNTKTKVFASTEFTITTGVSSLGTYDGVYYGADGTKFGYLAQSQVFKWSQVPVPNSQRAHFFAVNNSGVAVGSYTDSGGAQHGMMMSKGVVTNIDDPKGVQTYCFGINTSNQIVGDYFDTSGNPHGFLYSGGSFTDIPGPPSALSDDVSGINDAGDIAGDYFDSVAKTHFGFLLKGGTYTTLNPAGSTNTFGGGINATDQITFYWVDSSNYVQSSLYSNSTKQFTTINVPGASHTYAQGINKTGSIVFIWYDLYGVGHSAVKKGTVYSVFDFPKGTNTSAEGINDAGVVVGFFTPAGQTAPQPFQTATAITSFSPTSGPVGTTVIIKGTALEGATEVTFGGVSATFTVNSESQITATVPTGAKTGKIGVKVNGVTVSSSGTFTVT